MSSEIDRPRQRTVAELLAEHGDAGATGRRRRRREAELGGSAAVGRAGFGHGGAAPVAVTDWTPDRSLLRRPVPPEDGVGVWNPVADRFAGSGVDGGLDDGIRDLAGSPVAGSPGAVGHTTGFGHAAGEDAPTPGSGGFEAGAERAVADPAPDADRGALAGDGVAGRGESPSTTPHADGRSVGGGGTPGRSADPRLAGGTGADPRTGDGAIAGRWTGAGDPGSGNGPTADGGAAARRDSATGSFRLDGARPPEARAVTPAPARPRFTPRDAPPLRAAAAAPTAAPIPKVPIPPRAPVPPPTAVPPRSTPSPKAAGSPHTVASAKAALSPHAAGAPTAGTTRAAEPPTEQLSHVRGDRAAVLEPSRRRTSPEPGRRGHLDDAGPPTLASVPFDLDDGRPAGLGANGLRRSAARDTDDLGGPDDGRQSPADTGPPRRAVAPASSGQAWAGVVAQWILGAVGGAALWVGFRFLWQELTVVAVAAAVVVTVGLVLVVRHLLRNDDRRTTVVAVLIGLLLTVSPGLLVLLHR